MGQSGHFQERNQTLTVTDNRTGKVYTIPYVHCGFPKEFDFGTTGPEI